MIIKLELAEWLPDRPGVVNALTEATNVYAVANGYAPVPNKSILSDQQEDDVIPEADYGLITDSIDASLDYELITDDPASDEEDYGDIGSVAGLKSLFVGKTSSITVVFAGSMRSLFLYNQTTQALTDVSQTGGYTANNGWEFTQFGKVVIAANGTDKLQGWTVGSSTEFADLSADAPTASFVTVVRDFVVAARDSTDANKVYWSDINDETNWTAGAASQADTQLIADGGDIMGLTGGEFGLVLMQRSIARMSYTGSPFFFQFDNISRGVGCFASGSVAQFNGITYFLADNGFYKCDGQSVVPIGAQKVDRFFFDDVQAAQIELMSAAVDPIKKLIIWNYYSVDGQPAQLIYSVDVNKWTYARLNIDYISEIATSGVTLEELNNLGNLDTIQQSLDSRIWTGGALLLAAISDSRIVTIDGSPMTAQIVTGDIQLDTVRSVATYCRPVVENGSASIAVASRDILETSLEFPTPSPANSEGRVPARSSGRYHRFKVVPSGQWKTAVAIEANLEPQGIR